MVGIAGIGGIPTFLINTPTIGENMRGAMSPMTINGPVKGLEGTTDGAWRTAASCNTHIIELRVRCHTQHIGCTHISMIAPFTGFGTPIRRPTTDNTRNTAVCLPGFHRPSLGSNTRVQNPNNHSSATKSSNPNLIHAKIIGHISQIALGC